MKKSYVIIIVIVIIAIVLIVIGRGKKLEAPVQADPSGTSAGSETANPESPQGGQMGKMDMTPSPIPADFNAAVTVTTAPLKEFTVTGQNFSFAPSTLSVKKGDHVKITFKNAGGFHDLKIDEFKVATHQIKTGEEETIEFIADKTGSFQYYCSVGSHRQMGMWGTLTVQ